MDLDDEFFVKVITRKLEEQMQIKQRSFLYHDEINAIVREHFVHNKQGRRSADKWVIYFKKAFNLRGEL